MRLLKSLVVLLSMALLAGCGPEALEGTPPTGTPDVAEVVSDFAPVEGERRTGYVLDEAGNPVEISFIVAEGRAIVGGDMDFGAAGDIATTPEQARQMASEVSAFSNYRVGTLARWPDNGTHIIIPYVKTSNPTNGAVFSTTAWNNVVTAMNDIHAKTRVRFVAHSGQADYVRIYPGNDTCQVGRRGGPQDCRPTGNLWQVAAHELGHAIGLHHEHQRSDRGTHVWVYLDRTTMDGEFAVFPSTEAARHGNYDFNSIMHYGPTQFASGTAHTIEPNLSTYPSARKWFTGASCTDSSIPVKPMGCRSGFSAGDNAGINGMYGAAVAGPNAKFIGFQNLPTTMKVGTSYTVTVVMENNGGVSWDPALGYKLGSQNAPDNTTWGFNRAALPGAIHPGQWGYIHFTVRAPPSAGTYNFQWRMLREGVAWFGDYTANQPINVVW
ncbi:MAG TPA: M12 family metallopeptidase [Myxococcaceae bacterium]|nr:M12 family metallopeptidase [Myxococcaceae bacterium]